MKTSGATQFITDSSGRKKAVVLRMEEYEEIQEDIHDLAVLAERRNEKTISHESLKKKLKADKILGKVNCDL
ncbi:MAG: hypothetical protein HZB29_14395 [Nitrospinae bacterium]|nr:hypothetical protein [Nitrospinota bacterium]